MFKPELAIFDLDGTLIEFHHDYLFSQTARALENFGHDKVSKVAMTQSFSAFDYFNFVIEDQRESFISAFWEQFDWKSFPSAQLIQGTEQALKILAEHNVRLAIATSRLSTLDELKLDLADTGLLSVVEFIVTRESEDIHWTDKTGHLKTVCNELKVEPNRALMVGDIPPDIRSAKDVGIGLTAGVLTGGIDADVLASAEPDYLVKNLEELIAKLSL